MSFLDDFNSCMSSNGLPSPSDVFDSLSDALDFLEKLHTAWESAGGGEMTLAELVVALGALTGVDEAVAAVAAEAATVLVSAYLAACLECLVSAAGSAVWDLLATTDDPWLKDQLHAQAVAQNIPDPNADPMA